MCIGDAFSVPFILSWCKTIAQDVKYIIWNEWQKKKLQNPQIGLFWFKFSRLAHVSMVFTGNRSNVKNFRWQTCSVLNLANLAILCQKWGVRDGAVVRGLASHQSGLGSANPGVDFIRVQSLLLALSFAPRGFSPGTPVFPSPQKPTFPNTNSTRNQVHESSRKTTLWICYL